MLSNGFDKPLDLRRKPSTQLAVFLFAVHVLALLSLTHSLAIPLPVHVTLWLLWVTSAIYYACYYWPRSFDTKQYWIWQANGDWVINTESTHRVMRPGNTVVTPWFILVKLCSNQGTQHCFYFADQLDANTWRRLRVRLGCYQANETRSPGDWR